MFLSFVLLCFSWAIAAPRADLLPRVSPDPQAQLPFDRTVSHGVLPNGMTWFVEANKRPEGRAEIRLFAKVGSVLEADNERGVAHYLEHLAFNGTKHFPDQSLVTWLESLGMRFGADVNATTGLDETVFILSVPTTDPSVLDRALLVVRDWVDGIAFEDDECERERGVVLEEWRRSQGLGERLVQATYPYEYANSLYVERRPGADEAAIDALNCGVARAFHDRWYRPDLLAVAVVGDVTPALVTKQIKKRLGDLKTPADAPARPVITVPHEHPLLVSLYTDAELPDRLVRVVYKRPHAQEHTHAGYERFLMTQMAFLVLSERLGLASITPDGPWESAGAFEGPLGLRTSGDVAQATPKPGRERDALAALLEAVHAIKQTGISESELARARRQMQSSMDAYYAERNNTDSSTHIDELGRAFLDDEPVPGIPYEYAMSKQMLPAITVDDMNALIRSERFFAPTGRVVEVLAPAGSELPTEADVRALVDQVDQSQVASPEEDADDVPIVTHPPEPGQILAEQTDPVLATTTFTLSNGVKVVLLTTSLQSDQIVVEGFAKGGAYAEPEALIYPALVAPGVARRSGVGEIDAPTLVKMLAGRNVGVLLSTNTRWDIVRGASNVAELPTLFELLWALASEPRLDRTQFELDMQARRNAAQERTASASARFDEAWSALMWQNNPYAMPWSTEEIDSITFEDVTRAWHDRLSDLDDLTLVVVGNVTPDVLRPLLTQWVASLPGSDRDDTPHDTGERRVAGGIDQRVEIEGLATAVVQAVWHMPWDDTPASRLLVQSVSDLLGGRLHDELREALGGTYQVESEAAIERWPSHEAVISVSFECDPARVDELLAAMDDVVSEVRTHTWPDQTFEVFRTQNLQQRQSDMQRNAWWASTLASSLRRGEPVGEILDYREQNEAITPEAVRHAAQKLLRDDHRVRLTGLPTP